MTENDEIIEPTTSSAGERLRVAREAKGLSLEELASQTRIPLRHLQSLLATVRIHDDRTGPSEPARGRIAQHLIVVDDD